MTWVPHETQKLEELVFLHKSIKKSHKSQHKSLIQIVSQKKNSQRIKAKREKDSKSVEEK
jgi:hypothetical protein